MMNKIDVSRRIKTVFAKKGRSTESTDLAEANTKLAEEARSRVGIGSDEVVVLISKVSTDRWSVLTESKLIWLDATRMESVKFDDVNHVRVNFDEMRRAQRNMCTVDALEVELNDGTTRNIPVEAGGALSGFWNALLAVTKMSKRPDQQS